MPFERTLSHCQLYIAFFIFAPRHQRPLWVWPAFGCRLFLETKFIFLLSRHGRVSCNSRDKYIMPLFISQFHRLRLRYMLVHSRQERSHLEALLTAHKVLPVVGPRKLGESSAELAKVLGVLQKCMVWDIVQMDLVMHIRSIVIVRLIKLRLNWIESIIIYHLINLCPSVDQSRFIK